MTIVIVTIPRNAYELKYCLETYRRFGPSDLNIILITEPEHIRELREKFPSENIQPIPPQVLEVPNGYYRQQAAKLYCPFVTDDPFLVITDDDTEALKPYDKSTFFTSDGKAIVHFRNTRGHHNWAKGAKITFLHEVPYQYQLLLPFAIRRESLCELISSEIGVRAVTHWLAGRPVSEFETMGEWVRTRDQARAEIRIMGTHWTIDKLIFRDWQCYRRSFRKKIASLHR